MAFTPVLQTGGRRSRGLAPMAEINVTPFVDVVLVLLIIFMITAHVMEYGIDVEVPKTKSVSTSTKDLPVVTISKSGEIYLGTSKDIVNYNRLAAEIKRRYPGQDSVYMRADGEAKWDTIANVMAVLGEAKFRVSAVTQPDDNIGKRR
jgi:biopolymer transport protein ExbD